MSQTARKFAHGDYTVGWICALPETEFVAAGAMLDEEHPVLPAVHSQDTNSYLLGRIGDHNVVIACLPAETTGKVSATAVAKDMLRSFPAVRFGLMVGIGGGAPYYGTQGSDQEEEDSEDELEDIRDIRLGDVVVSLHSKSAEAVVQYDFGKSQQEKEFVHTGGKLNKPPAIVLSAVSVLQQQHRRKGQTICELLADTLSKNPGMAQEFRYPGSVKDRLFKPDVVHLEGRKSCKACCGPNSMNLVRRTDRRGTAPKIHYGTIGSADQVMRDAILRNKWAQKEKIICFEMEAAGLMDSFPCLVIRGICDYADSHKNKIWQPYAAATAASYAKELLLVIPGQGVMDLSPIEQSLGKIEANVDTMRSKLARKEDYDLLNWITADDYGPLQSDHFRRRQAGTGEWLLNSMEFQKWLETSQETLFCPGIPGAGKTILTSIVIDHLTRRISEDRTLGVAYVYCNFQQKDEQTVDRLLSSLLKQLSERLPTIPGEVSDLYKQHKKYRTRPSLEEISRTLHSVAIKYSRVFILVDALDECRESENCRIKFLSELFSLQARCGINIFATSRMNGEIEKSFTSAISLEIRATDHDVEIYLDERMRLQQLDILDDDTKKEIKRTVVDATGGMFLLAKLHIKSLITLPTKGHIKDALRNLAKGEEALDKTYSQTMERIDDHPKERRDLAKQILGWVFYGRRPLSILELRYALAVKTQSAKVDKDYVPSTKLIRSLCLGLVTIDKGSAIVRLVHYTTQEYFRRTQSRWFPSAELEIVQTCITILSFDKFKGFCSDDAELHARIRLNLLYHYSARHWGHHAREASIRAEQIILSLLNGAAKVSSLNQDRSANRTSAHIAAYLAQRNKVLEFLNSESNISGSSQAMLVNEGYGQVPNHSQDVLRQMTSMHLATYFGLSDIVGILIRDGHDPNTGDSYERTPLSWAAENGHKEVVCLLLEMAGIDPDAKAKW
ncbi:hypothetical protein Asppvi_000630 [Aspergillus pseudoviridinutans]|uniref:Purine and uridine phosphorylase n=1 Tax=Aspergillus pseudoviridinutans TaxID=1517512 RepID=A0A9P3B1S5_9EURO|nr:uncharacterized protein Asppvi_000630 [Aspergillus pseudoviridinutans]GIJ82127.1 hypothetical protein Asppvi_000630 [Aspergillus pseudoviridinutans]